MKKLCFILSLFALLCLLLPACSRLALPLTGEEIFTSAPDGKECSLPMEMLPENFTAEFVFSTHRFKVIRRGNELLKQNYVTEEGEFTYYKKTGDNWSCSYLENGVWNENVYIEDDSITAQRCLYFLCEASDAKTEGVKTGRKETVAGLQADEYELTDAHGTEKCLFSEETGMTVKICHPDGSTDELLSFDFSAADFPVEVPAN